MICYLPENLDIEAHLQRFPPDQIDGFSKENLIYILSLLLSIPATNKDIAEKLKGWVPISSKILANKIKNYRAYLDYALGFHHNDSDAIIIKTDNYYIPGEKSKWYCFINLYSKHLSVKPIIINQTSLAKSLIREGDKKKRLVSKQYNYLTKWFNPNLKINAEAARKYVEELKNKELGELLAQEESIQDLDSLQQGVHNDGNTQILTEEEEFEQVMEEEVSKYLDIIGQEVIQNKYLSYLLNINRIDQGEYFLSVDANIRRLHTNLTNLKGELRNFLTYDEQPLVSIDIKNSQPFLSMALFNPNFLKEVSITDSSNLRDLTTIPLKPIAGVGNDDELRSSRKFHLSTVAPSIYEELRNTEIKVPDYLRSHKKVKKGKFPTTLLFSLIMFSRLIHRSDNEDVMEFKNKVVSGMLYDFLKEKFRLNLGITFSSNKEVKAHVFSVLFTDNRFIGQAKAAPKKLFAEIFPTVYRFFSLFKNKDKTVLPRILQSIESWLVLDKVCKRIAKEKKDLPIFTIHDSILTTQGNEGYVRSIMEEEIERYLKFKPNLAIEVYNPDKLLPFNNSSESLIPERKT